MPGIAITPEELQAKNVASMTAADPVRTTQVQSVSDAWKRLHSEVPAAALASALRLGALNEAGWL